MGVLDRRHRDVGVLVDHASADIVPKEQLADRDRSAAIGDSDVRADAEVLNRCLDQVFGFGRAIDVDGLRPLIVPGGGHQCTDACGVIVVMVGDEYRSDVAHVEACLRNSARGSIPRIDHIQGTIDDQKVG